MRKHLKKLKAYIFRSWEDEPGAPHPRLRLVPPFVIDLLTYFILFAVMYQIVKSLLK